MLVGSPHASLFTCHRVNYMVNFGTSAREGLFPQYVTLYLHAAGGPSMNFCGGTLVQPRLVLTAAHCMLPDFELAGITVVNADETMSTFAKSFAINPSYQPTRDDQWQFDVASVLLSGSFVFPQNHAPDVTTKWEALPDNAPLSLVGRGFVCNNDTVDCRSRTLMLGSVRKVERARCLGGEEWQWPEDVLGRGTLCAGGGLRNVQTPRACPGDSGGPLFDDAGTVYAAVSGGDGSNGVCGGTLRPTLFSGFSFNRAFVNWALNGTTVNLTSRSGQQSVAPPRRAVRLVFVAIAVLVIL